MTAFNNYDYTLKIKLKCYISLTELSWVYRECYRNLIISLENSIKKNF